jgi:hypothetical protein
MTKNRDYQRLLRLACFMSLAIVFTSTAIAADIVLTVDRSVAANGDCKVSACWTITQAVAKARSERKDDPTVPIAIQIAPGSYVGNYGGVGGDPHTENLPIILDVGGLALNGSTVLESDSAGIPTGNILSGETRLESDGPLHSYQMLVGIVPTSGTTPLSGVAVRGLVLDAHVGTTKGSAFDLVLDRATGVTVQGNMMVGAHAGVNSFMASGVFRANYAAGNDEFGITIGSGSNIHPASVLLSQNRLVENGIMGLAIAGTFFKVPFDYGNAKVPEVGTREIPDTLNATIDTNILSDNGVQGIRVLPYLPIPNGDQHFTNINLLISNNEINGNGRAGLEVGSGFTWRAKSAPGPYSFAFSATLNGNTVTGNGRWPALLTFRNANWATRGTPSDCDFQPAIHSTITITDPENSLAGARTDDPEFDPNYVLGAVCNRDVLPSAAPLDNTMIINGVIVP